jgi:prepilin-type N-terminal cleavage/methylation domain-containing protein
MRQSRAGFTLIELLIVVVIIGILASFAVPKFQSTKGKAHAAGLRSDLRNMATAQEAYLYDNGTYSVSLAALNFIPSSGDIFTFGVATPGGWSATVTHPLAFPIKCAMFIGGVPPLAPATIEGLMACN